MRPLTLSEVLDQIIDRRDFCITLLLCGVSFGTVIKAFDVMCSELFCQTDLRGLSQVAVFQNYEELCGQALSDCAKRLAFNIK